MGDMREAWDDWRAYWKERQEQRVERVKELDNGSIPWVRHTDVHWSLSFPDGSRLDYWPTRGTFMHTKRVTGRNHKKGVHTSPDGMVGYINNRLKEMSDNEIKDST